MKFACTVIGHERIQREGKDGAHEVRVKMRGQSSKVRVEIVVPEEERDQYPYGASAVLDFSVQQQLNLTREAKPEKRAHLSAVKSPEPIPATV